MIHCSSNTTWQGEPDKPFIDASTGHAAKLQQRKQYGTTHADQTYRQNSSQQKNQKAVGPDGDANGLELMKIPVLFSHNSHLITSSDRYLFVCYFEQQIRSKLKPI